MALPYATPNQVAQVKKELESKISPSSDCVKINHKSAPWGQTPGTAEQDFPGKNFVIRALYGVDTTTNEERRFPVVIGNAVETVDASFNHTIPERDVDGRLFSYCYQPGGGKSYNVDQEYMVCNVGAVNW